MDICDIFFQGSLNMTKLGISPFMDIHPNPGPASSDSNGTSLDIFHLNARSIRNKLEDIYSIAEEYYILCFSELIWIKA